MGWRETCPLGIAGHLGASGGPSPWSRATLFAANGQGTIVRRQDAARLRGHGLGDAFLGGRFCFFRGCGSTTKQWRFCGAALRPDDGVAETVYPVARVFFFLIQWTFMMPLLDAACEKVCLGARGGEERRCPPSLRSATLQKSLVCVCVTCLGREIEHTVLKSGA